MKTIQTTILAMAVLTAGGALATDTPIDVPTLQVKERLAVIEQINVTAKKEVDPSAEAVEADIAAILETAAALEKLQKESAEQSVEQ